jgi:acyl-CoA thioesterase-1
VSEPEVVVLIDGLPRPAVEVARNGDRVLVRFRNAGQVEERWVSATDVVPVEQGTTVPWLKIGGLALVAVFGLALLLLPGGSDKPLLSTTPAPTPRATASPEPTASPVTTAVLFGDSFTAGKGSPSGTHTALQVAADRLGWRSLVLAQQGTGFTTTPSYATRLAHTLTSAPTVLLLEGGASDTAASTAQLTAAATSTLQALHQRFPTTRIVLIGPVAMEQPPDAGLVRVSHALKAVAAAQHATFVDPIPWITAANSEKYLSPTGYYPNAAGHAYLGRLLAAALS